MKKRSQSKAQWIHLKVNHTMHLRIEMFKKCSKIATDFDPVKIIFLVS
jgi:hypothetical protein